jgi:predicted Zn-dependent protease
MKRFATPLAIAILLIANIFVGTQAYAHQWGSWHWHRGGASVQINMYNTATYRTEASNAINDWNNNTILYTPQLGSHTDVHVFDGNYGANGWAGLASLESVSGSHILHAHARLNYYYSMSSGYKQGVQCQEVGHTFGIDHSNTGSCMGLGYWAGNGYYTNSHDWSDVYNMYRYHQ